MSFSSQPIFDSIQEGPSIQFDFPYTAGGSVIPGNFDFDRQHRVQRLPLRHGNTGLRPRAADMGHDASRLRQPRICRLSQEKSRRRRLRPSLIGLSLIGSSLIGSRRFQRQEHLRKSPAFSPGATSQPWRSRKAAKGALTPTPRRHARSGRPSRNRPRAAQAGPACRACSARRLPSTARLSPRSIGPPRGRPSSDGLWTAAARSAISGSSLGTADAVDARGYKSGHGNKTE